MQNKEILIITFPVDLGNRTIEANLMNIFGNKALFFRFSEDHHKAMDVGKIGYWQSQYYKLIAIRKLRTTVKHNVKLGKIILFYGVSPALFSFGLWNKNNAAITLDWSRTLIDFAYNKKIKKDIVFIIQKKVLSSFTKFLCCTDTLIDNLINVYGIEKSFIHKVPAPLLVENMDFAPRNTPPNPKVLFVGGDLIRKGGDLLLAKWKDNSKKRFQLTMMTNDSSANLEGIKYLNGIKYGTIEHHEIFKEHDILVLPTRFDSYPQVIGEAAAAGLVVITTKYALLSSEIILPNETGYICDTPEDCITKLEELVQNPILINKIKKSSYTYIHEKFDKREILSQYLNALNN